MTGDNKFSFKQMIFTGLRYWYLFITIPPLMLAGAYYYLKYTMPTYTSEAMILIKDDENSGQPNEEILFTELGLGKKNKTLENETLILKSTPLLGEVVRKLNLQYEYTGIEGFKKTALYKNSPIQVLTWHPVDSTGEFYGVMSDNGRGGYRLEVDKHPYNGEFGKELKMPYGVLTLAHKPGSFAEMPIGISILPVETKARIIVDELKVEIMGELSSTLHLSIKDHSPERARDILTELMNTYNASSVEVKNRAFEKTIDMVNERINLIAQNLSQDEQSVEAYKRNYSMMDLSAEGTRLLTDLSSYNREITGSEAQLEILSAVEDSLVKNKDNFEFVPSNLGVNNQNLSGQLNSFNQLLDTREKLRNEVGASHPELILTERQIRNLRQTILDNIHSIKNDLQVASDATKGARYSLESRLQSLPRHERELVELSREKDVKANLYLYLLQKREEAAVSLAVTVARGRIVEPAAAIYTPISPKRSQMWLIAIFLGLAIPIGIIVLRESLNDKIQTEEDITTATSVPLGGTLGLSRKGNRVVVSENSRSAVAEMFRLLRANLAYISPGQELRSLLVTSSTSGEGKSYISLNLGMTLALAGKKVLIVELDLRKPKQEAYLNIEQTGEGIVNYLVDPNMQPFQIIRNTGLHPNLDFISSGPTPPNPGELILSPRLRTLLDDMRNKYDFILLDAPPVGRVADALQMKDLAEATMYVVRTGYTYKGQLGIIEDISEKKKLPRPFIVLNGIPINKPGYQGSYTYGYGYGYGNSGYYEQEKKQKKAKPVKQR